MSCSPCSPLLCGEIYNQAWADVTDFVCEGPWLLYVVYWKTQVSLACHSLGDDFLLVCRVISKESPPSMLRAVLSRERPIPAVPLICWVYVVKKGENLPSQTALSCLALELLMYNIRATSGVRRLGERGGKKTAGIWEGLEAWMQQPVL